jgi:hypothetical protein
LTVPPILALVNAVLSQMTLFLPETAAPDKARMPPPVAVLLDTVQRLRMMLLLMIAGVQPVLMMAPPR